MTSRCLYPRAPPPDHNVPCRLATGIIGTGILPEADSPGNPGSAAVAAGSDNPRTGAVAEDTAVAAGPAAGGTRGSRVAGPGKVGVEARNTLVGTVARGSRMRIRSVVLEGQGRTRRTAWSMAGAVVPGRTPEIRNRGTTVGSVGSAGPVGPDEKPVAGAVGKGWAGRDSPSRKSPVAVGWAARDEAGRKSTGTIGQARTWRRPRGGSRGCQSRMG